MALAEEWYAETTVGQQDSIKEQIDVYLAENNLINKPYDEQTRQVIRDWLSSILGKGMHSLNPVLNLYGYKEVRCSQNNNASTRHKKKIVRG